MLYQSDVTANRPKQRHKFFNSEIVRCGHTGWLGRKGSNRALQFSNLSQDDDPKEIEKFGRAERKLSLPMAALDGSRQESSRRSAMTALRQ
jgi:hypothetical protein